MHPFVLKYKPTDFSQIIGNTHIIQRIQRSHKYSSFNLILYGPPGTGKTSCLQLLNKDRNNKKAIYDHADNISHDTQKYIPIKHNVFFLAANNIDGIIEPLKSACQIEEFKPIDKELIKGKCLEIIQKENIKYEYSDGENDPLDRLAEAANGDMRKALNLLQSIACYGEVSHEAIDILIDKPTSIVFKNILNGILEDNWTFFGARTKIYELIKMGYDIEDILNAFWKVIQSDKRLKSNQIENAAICYHKLITHSKSNIQIDNFLKNLF